MNQLEEALSDLREAIKLSPQNMELHRFTMQVKAEIEISQSKSNSNKVEKGSRISLVPEIIIASTPKKELESEV